MDPAAARADRPDLPPEDSPVGSPPAAAFATTQWSVVLDAKYGSFAALEHLCERYREPLRRHLMRKGLKPHQADDLIQDFFRDKFLRDSFFRSVGNSRLIPEHLLKPRELAERLLQAADPVARFLREHLGPETLRTCESVVAGQAAESTVRVTLAEHLNAFLESTALYAPERFAHLDLSEPTRIVLASGGRGTSRVRLNRLLLEDAFRGVIARSGGRFRTFVLTALDRFFISRSVRARRDPSDPDSGATIGASAEDEAVWEVEPTAPPVPDEEAVRTLQDWSEQVLHLAEERHRQEFLAAGKPAWAFEGFDQSYREVPEAPSTEDFATRLGIKANALYVAKHRFEARRKFWLREVVMETVSNRADWEDEVRALLGGWRT